MGTRADFYVGRGDDMKWVGSVAWDGYPDGFVGTGVMEATTEGEFLEALATLAADRKDFTDPKQGWPWPWADSFTTDYAYAFDGDRVYVSCEFDGRSDWVEVAPFMKAERLSEEELEALPSCGPLSYPNMEEIQNVDFGDRSGLMIVRV